MKNTDLGTGQPNWEYTMWKYQDFSQILREINFCYFEALKLQF